MTARDVGRAIWHVLPRMLITWGLALGLLAGLNWIASQFIASPWTQGFVVGVAAIILGDLANLIEVRWIYGPPEERRKTP